MMETPEKHTISVLVENKFGVLARVAGLFSGFQCFFAEVLQRANRADIAESCLRPLGMRDAYLVTFRRWLWAGVDWHDIILTLVTFIRQRPEQPSCRMLEDVRHRLAVHCGQRQFSKLQVSQYFFARAFDCCLS